MNLKTRIRSTGMRYFSSEKYQHKRQANARKRREKKGEPPTVHYFHQVDDPYSHLAVQKLDLLKSAYALDFQPHLVTKPDAAYQGSSEHFEHWALQDCINIADDYGTQFVSHPVKPNQPAVSWANNALAPHLSQSDFAQAALDIGTTLWSNQSMDANSNSTAGEGSVRKGNRLRKTLGHYQGAMFYFDGEWYWGIDRIRLLEQRLLAEGLGNNSTSLCVPQPTAKDTSGAEASEVLLEYFPSLRSPYTTVGHQRVLDLITRSGVRVKVRPVMPMLMRGVPAPPAKQRYIITDAGREARAHNVPFGPIVDPFGEPVKRAFALFPAAAAMGKDMEFITAYLTATWHTGTDITTENGLRQVARSAGIEWNTLEDAKKNTDWQTILADNLKDMLKQNLWGVPSFRVSGGNSDQPYACWGQDRIWRVENEIAARI